MILGIEVLCEACGTELEITDVNTDHLLKVTLKAKPCPKCNRPPDCHLSCEDVLELRRKLKTATDKVKELEKQRKETIGLGGDLENDKDKHPQEKRKRVSSIQDGPPRISFIKRPLT